MTAEREVTEPIAMSAEENSSEDREVNRATVILKRLDAISTSVSFHYKFLGIFAMIHSLKKAADDAENETQVEKSDFKQDENDRETARFVYIADDEGKSSCDSEHSGDETDSNDAPSDSDSPDRSDRGIQPTESPDVQIKVYNRTSGIAEVDICGGCPEGISGATNKKQLNVQYCYKFNLFSTEYLADSKLTKAKTTNEAVLLAMPDNFNGLWNQVKLMTAVAEESGDCIDERAEEILDQLEEMVSHNGKQILIAKAETAAMYTDLVTASGSLVRCIKLYEEALAEENSHNRNECVDYVPEKLVVFWKCYLVRAYAMLTNANRELLAEYGFNHGEVLSRLEDLVLAVDSSVHIKSRLKAQTWVDLANTFEHYRQNYKEERVRQEIYYGNLTLADCLANASEHDPDNSTILLRRGRELRQRSASERDYHEAIRLFQKALDGEDIEDKRDIINHHMGLTYRSLWLLEERPIVDRTTDDAYRSTRAVSARQQVGCRVIKPPDHPLAIDDIPQPYVEPPKAAYWKILNPIARNPKNQYLLNARACFEEANLFDEEDPEISETLYLMEIARIYSSLRNTEIAHEYLLKAEKQPNSDIVDVDFVGNSLYEHIGLLEENEMIRRGFNEADAEKVKSFYRESIRLCTVSKTKPLVAFHYLLRVLYKQLEGCVGRNLPESDQMIIQSEYFLLYMAIQQADVGNKIVNSIATDDFRVALIWRLIEMFSRRNQQYDAAAAFTYLSILVMAKQFTTEVKGVELTTTEKQRILLQSAERVTLERVDQPRYLPQIYRELQNLLHEVYDVEKDTTDCRVTLTDMERKRLDIVMQIVQPEFSPGYSRRLEQCY